MSDRITCIIVDDDEIDRLYLQAQLRAYPQIEINGIFANAVDALKSLSALPDCLFCDVDMPEMNGLQLRQTLMEIPCCIFITAFPEYAVESFELEALDFLVKPFTTDRFAKTMQRLLDYQDLRNKADLLTHTLGADSLFIKDGHTQLKLQLHEILYLEALNNYTGLITESRKHTVLAPIGNLLQQSAFSNFIRIHRSYAVPRYRVQRITANRVWLADNIELPLGRTYKNALSGLA